ncbi:MAG: hypothetical protein JKY15_00300 [Deltaproteobacteria bacterium]|nr:hypothetical protein [Deltaproteobacteria bacterium]
MKSLVLILSLLSCSLTAAPTSNENKWNPWLATGWSLWNILSPMQSGIHPALSKAGYTLNFAKELSSCSDSKVLSTSLSAATLAFNIYAIYLSAQELVRPETRSVFDVLLAPRPIIDTAGHCMFAWAAFEELWDASEEYRNWLFPVEREAETEESIPSE